MPRLPVAALSWLRSARADLARRFVAFDEALDAWAERRQAILGLTGYVLAFTLVFAAVALHAYETGFADAVAARCGATCPSIAGAAFLTVIACDGAAILFIRLFAGLTSTVQRAFDPWQFVRPGPPPRRVARWAVFLHVLIGFALFLAMACFAREQARGVLFEFGLEAPDRFEVRLADRAMLELILGWWIGGNAVLRFFWLRSSRYTRFAPVTS